MLFLQSEVQGLAKQHQLLFYQTQIQLQKKTSLIKKSLTINKNIYNQKIKLVKMLSNQKQLFLMSLRALLVFILIAQDFKTLNQLKLILQTRFLFIIFNRMLCRQKQFYQQMVHYQIAKD
ncbi:hypothetical protein TTHERM_000257059 (macronuclear) [Tetrahymena thermophila SB210]|uniref:Uncharacterized protein n=1 Tax=Tetrahymena thermophila (strain SB210) TaxID=312017 RepID=W7X2V4_TETTS|nr:hypothetical protein TTHERM_000257059 [Tetrahymena thermophila SB210]EWS73635.1 hypothetical protein TTHERM_000257059 [Tetrahymena thermophila SB210]|eukprot:XP_012653865.1 hypothetical protein TTHERM_000257059 [Tetrahymena thermophila SB210]